MSGKGKRTNWINYGKIDFRITQRKGKARQGKYFQIRERNKQKKRYKYSLYKYDTQHPWQEPLEYYKQLKKKGKTKISKKGFYQKVKEKIQKKRKIKIIKGPKLKQVFKEGQAAALLTTAEEMKYSPYRIYSQLLDKMISHKRLKNILIKEAQKWKHMLGYDVHIMGIADDINGTREIGKLQDTNKTIEEFNKKYEETGYKTNWHINSQKIEKDQPYLQYIEKTGKTLHTGTIKSIQINISLAL